MKYSALAFSLTLLLSCQSNPPQDDSDHKALPNIILLIGDDQGYPYFGFMGADYVQTPNMDQLADNGVLFTDGYVSDNHCRPSLQTLLTGMLPIDYHRKSDEIFQESIAGKELSRDSLRRLRREFDVKALALPHFSLLPKLLAQKGYVSFQGGKWWEFNYQNGGFTHGMTNGISDNDIQNAGWFLKHMGGEGMELARVTNQPVYYFFAETDGQPFFIWYAPSLPHYPFDAPDKYYNLYKEADMSESAKQYYANCTWFDDAWGELVTHLKEKALYDNTLIVYVNDNGWEQDPNQEFSDDPMRSHNGGDKGKSSIYDLSFRSPIIFAWANEIDKGVRSASLIHSADIPATILDYAGIETPKGFYGKSFREVIEDPAKHLRQNIFGNVINTRSKDPNNVMGDHVEGYWIRQDHWFLRWHLTYDELELFDLREDPMNNHNIAEAQPEIAKELQAKLKAYKAEKGVDKRLEMYALFNEQ